MILAIDTSAAQCAVALVADARTAVRVQAMTRGHAEALFPMIDEVLAELSTSFTNLTRIAVCTGPGSFTGLRVGIAAARGLALGLGIPAIGVTRFEAVAQQVALPGAVRLPGRQGTVFAQAFDAVGMPVSEPEIAEGDVPDLLADPSEIARIAMHRSSDVRPAPLYLRDADAALPREGPPRILD